MSAPQPVFPADDDPLSRYHPIDGVYDEMVDARGRLRPGWEALVQALHRIGEDGLQARFARARQYLADAGVYYRYYGRSGVQERDWPLAPLPVLLHEAEWRGISDGLAQRADLLERVIADLHGPQRLVREGLLPPALVAGNPEFLRPVVGVPPRGGHYLHFCAFELGRGPDGRWWVLGDRTQAPSGAGFALENRVAATRALGDVFGQLNVHRLAGFFRHFRDALLRLSGEGGVALLTPGPNNETYYEHAYIARYLGFLLLEGEDLTVRDGRLLVRTVAGLKPVSVLWRRLDAEFLDPLELRPDSRIGTPGMVEALRHRAVTVANAAGSGLLETRALLAFLPGIAEAWDGAPLALSGIATWWCGQERERAHVVEHLERMMIGPALSTRLPFEDGGETVLGARLNPIGRRTLLARLQREGAQLVGQEAVTLSTTPVHVPGAGVEPRPLVLRAYAARTPDGWRIMPGGFARVGFSLDNRAITMQSGGQAADVWIFGDRPAARHETLLRGEHEAFARAVPPPLPSRAAENLFWLGRYIERLEGYARILRAWHARLAESPDPELPLLRALADYLDPLGVDVAEPVPAGLVMAIDSAVTSAGRIRDRFSPDGWMALRDLAKTARRFASVVGPGDDAVRAMGVLLRKLAGFSGLVHENMYRFAGWRFLEVGRRIERGIQMAWLLAAFTPHEAPSGASDALLEIGDSVITHRARYGVDTGRLSVLDLLALDPHNPRSVLFQLDVLRHELGQLPDVDDGSHLSGIAKESLRLQTLLAIREPADVDAGLLEAVADGLAGLSDRLSSAYFG
jgi:uncharacterized circularly permuted ATP-grasp superfamily protein/uncharacterized alpha-E superfamily protein